jgi:hypothetical protein
MEMGQAAAKKMGIPSNKFVIKFLFKKSVYTYVLVFLTEFVISSIIFSRGFM